MNRKNYQKQFKQKYKKMKKIKDNEQHAFGIIKPKEIKMWLK